jgi:hypothetical protein
MQGQVLKMAWENFSMKKLEFKKFEIKIRKVLGKIQGSAIHYE